MYHKDKLPVIFRDYFHLNQSKYSYDTRNKLNFHLYSVNTTFGQRYVKLKGDLLLNNLHQSIKNIVSINNFKKTLRRYSLSLF